MFGTLRPHTCALETPVRSDYKRLYCGTCKGLGDHFGTMHRATLTWDAVLLAAAVDGLTTTGAESGTCRCPLNPLSHRDILVPDSVPMRVASAVQVLLTNQWVADQQRDGSSVAGWVRPLTERPTAHAAALLRELGIDPSELADLDERQGELERDGLSVSGAAEPTSTALGGLFAQLPRLPGAVAADAAALRSLGEAVGRAIYVVDALEDARTDAESGDFNPCVRRDRSLDGERVEDCVTELLSAVETIDRVLEALPIQRHREIIRHVLVDQLPKRADRAVEAARDAVFQQWHAASGRFEEIEEVDEEETKRQSAKTQGRKDGTECCICDCGPMCDDPACCCIGLEAGCCCLEFLI